ncbi:MAG: hypothetical protein A2V84_11095 [Chloroflexi bacterium RBG_16_70_13]|nr:MAG: hypothetical protein A2V84_11095 [Chloroflexi bacterium RBG_16_70_13]
MHRATLAAVAIVIGATGHLVLAPGTGARAPAAPGSPPAASFEQLDRSAISDRATDSRPEPGERAPTATGIDDWGLTMFVDPRPASEAALATATPAPPEVVRFRPRDGWTDVGRSAQLSVRFTTAMDHATTEAAFHATIDGVDMAGTVRWAEGDTVLVLRPSTAMPYAAVVELRVDPGARSTAGLEVAAMTSVTFTVQPRPRPTSSGSAAPSGWQWPLIGPITQYFRQTLTAYGIHQGIDIDGDTGDPVRAARSGVVVVAGYADECGGLQVRIDHGGGLLTWYRHLSAIETTVGAPVTAGTLIGRVGATGCAFGSHLHFGVGDDGEFVDPLRYLPPR